LFAEKPTNNLSVYFTAGYPNLGDTVKIVQLLEKHGADIVEIGMPYSDPVADGPVIQASNDKALDNGMNISLLFDQLADIRKTVKIPLILMGYYNPVLQYGMKAFCQKCKQVGIDAVILPDLPSDVYKELHERDFVENELQNIFLITPQTSEARIRMFDEISTGFIYAVSSSSITGKQSNETGSSKEIYFKRLQQMKLKNPMMIGFGISDQTTFEQACKYGNGAIVGSAFIKMLPENGDMEQNIKEFIAGIKGI